MTVYYLIFIISFILCFFDFVKSKVIKFFPYFIFAVLLVLFVGLRYPGIDNDSKNYIDMFEFYKFSSYQDIWEGGYGYVEKGYVLLNKVLGELGGNYTSLFLVMALLTVLYNYWFFFKNSKYPFFSLLFYLSFFFIYRDFTQIRYALSAAICFWVVYYYVNNKYKTMVFHLILAISFHNASVILIPALLVIRFVRVEKLLLLLPFPALAIGLSINLFHILILSGLGNEHVVNVYSQEEGGAGFVVSILGYAIMLLYFSINYLNKNSVTISKKENIYFKLVAFSVILNFLFINSAIAQRFSYILFQFSILLLPILLDKIRIKTGRIEAFFLIYLIIACFFVYYGIRMIDLNLVRPYRI